MPYAFKTNLDFHAVDADYTPEVGEIIYNGQLEYDSELNLLIVNDAGTIRKLTPTETASREQSIADKLAAHGIDRQQVKDALARLTQIVGATNPSNAQLIAAVQDMAKFLRALIRLTVT